LSEALQKSNRLSNVIYSEPTGMVQRGKGSGDFHRVLKLVVDYVDGVNLSYFL
jgi:hypothetical protein